MRASIREITAEETCQQKVVTLRGPESKEATAKRVACVVQQMALELKM